MHPYITLQTLILGRLGTGKLGTGKLGTKNRATENWAPKTGHCYIWAPCNVGTGKFGHCFISAPENWAPENWTPENWAPENWAPIHLGTATFRHWEIWAPPFFLLTFHSWRSNIFHFSLLYKI